MAQTSWPFENIDTTEVQFSQWARHINEGIRPDFANELEPFADDSGLNVKVKSGQAMVRGHYYASTAEETLTITTPDATNPRIDSVVLELDIVANSILLKVVAGTPAGSPVAPTLTQSEDGNVYQFLLGNVAVAAGVFSIAAGDVTDLRTYMFQGVGKWTTVTRPANPIDNQTIGYNSDLNTHEVWNGTAWTSVFAPITTEGDLAIGDNTGTAVRLPIGAADTVLTSDGTTAFWSAGGGGLTSYQVSSGGGTFTLNLDTGLYFTQTSDVVLPIQLDGNYITADSKTVEITNASQELITNNYLSPSSWQIDTAPVYADNTTPFALRDVTFHDGNYVFAGGDGQVAITKDLKTFTSVQLATTELLYSASYGNGIFLVGGNNGTLYSSTDLVTWTARDAGFGTNRIGTITYANGIFVALGTGPTLATSPDGITWTIRDSKLEGSGNDVNFGDGVWVACCSYYDGDYKNNITYSLDNGATWAKGTTFRYQYMNDVAYNPVTGWWAVTGGNQYGGRSYISQDGINWTEQTTEFNGDLESGLKVVLNGDFYIQEQSAIFKTDQTFQLDNSTLVVFAAASARTAFENINGTLILLDGGTNIVAVKDLPQNIILSKLKIESVS